MASYGSPVTQAAIARLGIQVALPSRGDIARGLSWMPPMLEGIFRKINQATLSSQKDAVSSQEALIAEMQNDEIASNHNRAAYIKRAETQSIAETLKRFAAGKKGAESLAMQSFKALTKSAGGKGPGANPALRMGIKTKEIQKDINKVMLDGTLVMEARIAKLGLLWESYSEERKRQVWDEINTEYQARVDNIAQLKSDTQILGGKLAKGVWQDPSEAAQKKEQLDNMNADLKISRGELEQYKPIWEMYKGLMDAATVGTKAFNAALSEEQQTLHTAKEALEGNIQSMRELSFIVTQKVQNALVGFRDMLSQSILTLTVFYYKLNQAVGGFQEFEKELINAQSIFQTTNETLYTLSNQIVEFGTQFGISYENAASGLYQFASAGLTAEQSIKVLNDTLKLSMAVQGDHNTISKLTTQVIYGFGLQMDDATEVTDKFAHAINKSLIEYQDLASAIKFSMPFFVSSGQSLDQLLGALQILTNRALEAGIAGRGLRQALAEFTQHAKDNAAGFRKLGVEILDTEGNMKDLTDIAQQFNSALGEQATDMEVMITLMEDLNIRGATAFIHLVQNADEYAAAVDDLKNSSGAAHEMAMIQQESLFNQIQILKNALMAPFLLADPAAVARGEMNAFAESVHDVVKNLKDMLIVEKNGNEVLSETGFLLREVAIKGIKQFGVILERVTELLEEFIEKGVLNTNMIKLYFLPITILIGLVDILGPTLGKLAVTLYILNKTLGLGTIAWMAYNLVLFYATGIMGITATVIPNLGAGLILIQGLANEVTFSFGAMAGAIGAAFLSFVIFAYIGKKVGDAVGPLIVVLIGLAIAIAAVYAALNPTGTTTAMTLAAWGALAAGGAGLMLGGVAAWAMPETEDIDMSGYEAQLEGAVSFGSNQPTTAGPEAIYVNKLVYTDSNVSEQMYTNAQRQKGATGEFI